MSGSIGVGGGDFPATRDWMERVRARPAVVRAMTRADLVPPAKYTGRQQVLSAREWSNMFGDAMHGAVRGF
ncbi:hypothetical protein GCM10011529_07840 [Polymorphobacter glacialis]|uniref:Uncharacterized protein n=1 Tax=Sandarakinorhabdus glacialis TaxID=1614636 RepID=A0A916ZMF5_9SPHN|nr:hypothetical protein GCM10011529_07840 [Polymorphobacter glacialis]